MVHVLVVDDDASNRLTLSALVEEEGFDVKSAESLAAARKTLAETKPPFDLALVDVHLGDGLGTDLIAELHASGAKVIMVSGTAEMGDAVTHADAAIAKGGAIDDLFALMKRVLRRSETPH